MIFVLGFLSTKHIYIYKHVNMEEHDIDIRKLMSQVNFKKVETNADQVYDSLWNRISYQAFEYRPGVSPFWKYISMAATLALLVVSIYSFHRMNESEKSVYMEVTAVAGSKTKVILPDSTKVWLNSNSTIRYPQKFTADTRKIYISGEALLQVTKDEKKPFIVNLDDMSVQVLGTTFNVFSDKHSDLIETTLLHGSVAIWGKTNNTGTPDAVLKPGQQAMFNKTTGKIDVKDVEAGAYASWVNGRFLFREKTLREITSMLERAYSVKIHLENEKLAAIRLTATFTNNETLDEILSILQISAKYTYYKKKGEIYIQ